MNFFQYIDTFWLFYSFLELRDAHRFGMVCIFVSLYNYSITQALKHSMRIHASTVSTKSSITKNYKKCMHYRITRWLDLIAYKFTSKHNCIRRNCDNLTIWQSNNRRFWDAPQRLKRWNYYRTADANDNSNVQTIQLHFINPLTQ